MNDTVWMQRALELARRGEGHVEPNPMVGALVVRDGRIVGEGWHQKFGEAHAEVHALRAADERARGATLYVTLEPCCHQGKTPPCTGAILGAGISRIVAAMTDPFAAVAGAGLEQLREAGLTVEVGLLEAEARDLNSPYLTMLSQGRPFVHAKWAMSLDGKVATKAGRSKWISGEASRRRAHELRGRMDAVIVGAGTVRTDDPMLTARPPGPRQALRVILSRSGDLPAGCQLLRTAREVPVLVAGAAVPDEKHVTLEAQGCEVLRADLPALMAELGRRRHTNVLVEGGAATLGAFRDAGLIDELHVFVAPMFIGSQTAPSPIGGIGAYALAETVRIENWSCEATGDDWYIHGRVKRPSAPTSAGTV
jgi:diaminohydroxyphosphoribosylaminopyrimidine deaminase/5-amino-6-(5-phosphoribosylamino)uracil reductase